MKEQWKRIPNLDYEVSNLGNVKSLKRSVKRFDLRTQKFVNHSVSEKILKGTINSNGYKRIQLHKNGYREIFKISRLILLVFVGPCPQGMECSHLNGNSQDDRLCNLKWETHQENEYRKIEHGTKFNLKNKDIPKIRKLLNKGYPQYLIALKFHVSQSHISNIKNGTV